MDMEKIYLLCFTKNDFITNYTYTSYNDGGGYVILASRHLEFLQMRMREEVNKFVEERIEFLKKIELEDNYEYIYEEIEEDVENAYWADGMGWDIVILDGMGWQDKPKFYIQEIEIS